MMVDTLIKNCKVVTSEGTFPANIGVAGEKIAALTNKDNLPEAARTIDAGGNYVLPGLVDGHMHLLYPPGDWADLLETETRAAAAGGVTTVVHCLLEQGAGSVMETSRRLVASYHEHGYVDMAMNASLYTLPQIREIPEALEFGISSFKFFLPYRGREALGDLPGIDDGILYMGFEEIGRRAREGYKTFARVHAESIEVFFAIEDRARGQGFDPPTYTEVRPNFIEEEALQRSVAFAKATDCPLFIVHMSAKECPARVVQARLEGVDIVAETCPQYLVLNTENTDRDLSKVNPPIRRKEDNEAMWKAVQEGVIDYMGTDHVPWDSPHKRSGFWRAHVGIAAVDTWLPIMLSEGINKGRISLERLVQVCSYNVAKKYGIAPRKGTIAVGSDADLVIVDLKKKATVRAKDLFTRCDYTNYEGWELQGWPTMTMLRGKVLFEDGKVVGSPGFGRYLPGKVK